MSSCRLLGAGFEAQARVPFKACERASGRALSAAVEIQISWRVRKSGRRERSILARRHRRRRLGHLKHFANFKAPAALTRACLCTSAFQLGRLSNANSKEARWRAGRRLIMSLRNPGAKRLDGDVGRASQVRKRALAARGAARDAGGRDFFLPGAGSSSLSRPPGWRPPKWARSLAWA